MKGVFVTGTDTGVGKTFVSAWLALGWGAGYWKPIQTGTGDGTDAAWVSCFAAGVPVLPSRIELRAPLSPDAAARLQNTRIDLGVFSLPACDCPLVVEGAGGALVPINEEALMVDLMARLGLPVVVVARSGLGTINHTLLTLEAVRRRGLAVLGVVMNGPADCANRRAIEHFGRTPVLAEIVPLADLGPGSLATLPPPSFACPCRSGSAS